MGLWHRCNGIFPDFLKIEEDSMKIAGGKGGRTCVRIWSLVTRYSCELGPTRKRRRLAAWDYPGEDRLKLFAVLKSSGGKFRLFLVGGPKGYRRCGPAYIKP
jgi:hypothetical protein